MTNIKWLNTRIHFTALQVASLLFAINVSAEDISTLRASAEFCSTIIQIESALSSSIPIAMLPPKAAKRTADYQVGMVAPLFIKARKTAPKDVASAVDTVASSTIQALSTLDFSAAEGIAFAKAKDSISAKMLSDCKIEKMQVTASNYEYIGIPQIIAAGETALTITNKGDEVHEISIARINDDINLSASEILSLPMKESLAAVTLIGYALTPPGGTKTTFLSFDKGRYYAVCFMPRGTMSLQVLGKGTPHVMLGMLKEFSVK